MKKIRKLTAIQPVSFLPESREAVKVYCEEAIFYDTEPKDDKEIIERIGDSDAIFVSYNRTIGENILSACPDLKYIGMCCSLYSAESSNVDIKYAEEHEIRVTGIRDYGDEGVAEYVTAELIRRLHGTDGNPPLLGEISEISGIKAGILGMGASAVLWRRDCLPLERISVITAVQESRSWRKKWDILIRSCMIFCGTVT